MQKSYMAMTHDERMQWVKQLAAETQQRYDEATYEAVLRDDNDVVAALTNGIIHFNDPQMRMLFGVIPMLELCRSLANVIYLRGYEHGTLARQVGGDAPTPPAPTKPQPVPIAITRMWSILLISTIGDEAAAWVEREAPQFGKLTPSTKDLGSWTLVVYRNHDAKQVHAYLEQGSVRAQTQDI